MLILNLKSNLLEISRQLQETCGIVEEGTDIDF